MDFPGWGKEKTFTLNLSSEGIVNKVHGQVVDRRGEIIFGFLNAAATIAGKGMPFGMFKADISGGATIQENPQLTACKGAKTIGQAATADQKAEKDKWDRICQAAYADFEQLRSLVTDTSLFSASGGFPANGDAHAAMLKARNDRIKELTEKFLGSKSTETKFEGKFEAVPLQGVTRNTPLFQVKGGSACAASQKPPATSEKPPATILLRRLSDLPECTGDGDYSIQLALAPRYDGNDVAANVKATFKDNGKDNAKDTGFAYRIPAWYEARIEKVSKKKDDKGKDTEVREVLLCQDVALGQLGAVAHLPSNLGGDASIDFTLDSATGALLQVALNGKPKILTDLPGQISALGSAGLDVLSAFNKAHPAATVQNPLDDATAARKLAQEQLRLLLIQRCMAQPDLAECATLVTQQ